MIAVAQIHSVGQAVCILAIGLVGLVAVYFIFYRGHE